MILTKEQIKEKKNRRVSLLKSDYELIDDRYRKHSDKWDFFKHNNTPRSSGQFFLYEIASGDHEGNVEFTYPRIGIYLDSYRADQTIEVEWVDHRRTWEYNTDYEFVSSYDNKTYTNIVADMRSELQYLILWGDQMLVYGVWDKMPNWKELRQAYEKTWWFYRDQDELRNIQLNRILND